MGRVFDFIANTLDGVFAVDRQQTIVLWNEAATAILGFTPDDVIGRKCEEILQSRDAQGCAVCRRDCKLMKAASHLTLSPTTDIRTRTKNGLDVWLNVSSIVMPSNHQALFLLIHLFRDVTHRHELEAATMEFTQVMSGLSSRDSTQGAPGVATLDGPAQLTQREREVVGQLRTGAPNQVIADRMCISPSTVRNHMNSIFHKLGVHSRLEVVAYSIRHGML